MSGKETETSSEHLTEEARGYLREVFKVLRSATSYLDAAGINLGRSRLGNAIEIGMEAIRALVVDIDFLTEGRDAPDALTGMAHLQLVQGKLKGNEVKTPELILTPAGQEILMGLGVLLRWGSRVADEKAPDGFAYSSTPDGMAVQIASRMIGPLIPNRRVERKFRELQGDAKRLENYLLGFRFQVNDILHPLPPLVLASKKSQLP